MYCTHWVDPLLGLACRYSLLTSLRLLTRGYRMLREKCVVGITANEEVCMNTVTNSIGIVTALLPFIGCVYTEDTHVLQVLFPEPFVASFIPGTCPERFRRHVPSFDHRYANASQAAKVALAEGKGVAEVVVQLGYLNAEQVAALLKPEMMTRPEEDAQVRFDLLLVIRPARFERNEKKRPLLLYPQTWKILVR